MVSLRYHGIDRTFGVVLSLVAVCEAHDCDTLHETSHRIAKNRASRFERAIDAYLVFRGHEKIAGLGRVMRSLLGDIIAASAIGIIPVASEGLAQDRVERLFHSTKKRYKYKSKTQPGGQG